MGKIWAETSASSAFYLGRIYFHVYTSLRLLANSIYCGFKTEGFGFLLAVDWRLSSAPEATLGFLNMMTCSLEASTERAISSSTKGMAVLCKRTVCSCISHHIW